MTEPAGIQVVSPAPEDAGPDWKVPGLVAGTGAAGGTVLASGKAYQLYHDPLTRKPVITVGGGRVYLPGLEGAGHITAARGLMEGLEANPDVQAGKVIPQRVSHITYQLDKLPEHMHTDVMVPAGFSGLPGDFGNEPPKGFTPASPEGHANYNKLKTMTYGRRIPFVPDSVKEMNATLTQPKGILSRLIGSVRNLGARVYYRNSILFGNKSFQPASFVHYPVSPAVTDTALAGIRTALGEGGNAASMFGEYADSIAKDQPEVAQYIRKGIADAAAAGREYSPIMISGSSGGNYVPKRTLDLMGALKGTEEEKIHQLFPVLGAGKDIAGQLIDGTNIPRIGGVPQEMYNKLRGAATLNLASAGASDLAEMHALPTTTMISTNHAELRDAEIAALGNKITDAQRAALQSVNTDSYNRGNMQGIATAKLQGMRTYSDPKDILAALRDPEFMDKAKNRLRAQQYLQHAVESKADLAKRLVSESYHRARLHNVTSNKGRIALVGGLGALTAGLGAYAGTRLLKPSEKAADVQPVKADDPIVSTHEPGLSTLGTGAAGAAIGGVGLASLDRAHNALTHTPSDRPVLTIAGGSFKVPGLDVGAGHVGPAKALVEAVQATPEAKELKLHGLYPHNFQFPAGAELPDKSHLTIMTGYSGAPEDIYTMTKGQLGMMAPGAEHPGTPALANLRSTRAMQFLTDPQRTINRSNLWEKIKQGIGFLRFAPKMITAHMDPNMIRFGDAGNWIPSWHGAKVNPAVSESTLGLLENMQKQKLAPEQVYGEFADWLADMGEKGGKNLEAANYIRKGIADAALEKRPYLPIFVTGSSRGDTVAQRALDIIEASKDLPHKYHVVPFLGGHGHITKKLLEGTGLPAITGRIPQELYMKIRMAAKGGLAGGFGAGDYAEALGMPVRMFGDELPRETQLREIENLKARGPLAAPDYKALDNARIDMFNEGQRQSQKIAPVTGISMAPHNRDNLRRWLANPMTEDEFAQNLTRATQHVADTRAAKATLGKVLVREAIDAAKNGRAPIWRTHPYLLAGGAAATGIGAAAAKQLLRPAQVAQVHPMPVKET